MRIRPIGRIDADLHVLGTAAVPVFLLATGPGSWALIEGGVAELTDLVLEQLRAVVGDLGAIHHWLITHSHYDHCGLLPTLWPRLPAARVLASAGVARAFASASARRVIAEQGRTTTLLPGSDRPRSAAASLDYAQIPITVVNDGDEVALAPGVTVRVLATPGHAACQLAFAVGARWFVSDALGELSADGFFPLIFHDAAAYRRTILRLAEQRPEVLVLAHHAVLTGADARTAPGLALAAIARITDEIDEALRTHDRASAARRLSDRYHAASAGFVSRQLHHASVRRMMDLLSPAQER